MAKVTDVTPGSDGSVRDVESAAAIVLSHCNYIVQFEVRPRPCRILPVIFFCLLLPLCNGGRSRRQGSIVLSKDAGNNGNAIWHHQVTVLPFW
jgi:hypothetical protein